MGPIPVRSEAAQFPLAGHAGSCNKVQVAQFNGHFKGKCNCPAGYKAELERKIALKAIEIVHRA